MITKKIISLQDQTLRTKVMSKRLFKNEVALITFANVKEFQAFLSMKVFSETCQPVGLCVPVVTSPITFEEKETEEIKIFSKDDSSPLIDAIEVDDFFKNYE